MHLRLPACAVQEFATGRSSWRSGPVDCPILAYSCGVLTFMVEIRPIVEEAGTVVLADAWIAGGFVSAEHCIRGRGRSRSNDRHVGEPLMLVGDGDAGGTSMRGEGGE